MVGDSISDMEFGKKLEMKCILINSNFDSGNELEYLMFNSLLEFKNSLKVDDFSSSNVAKKIKIPVLVIHDKTDGDVPVSCAYKIRQNLEKGSLLITSELGHTKILRNQEVIKKSINFIKQNT